jgi:hypothetical protein
MDTRKTSYCSLEAIAAATALPRKYLQELAECGRLPHLRVNGRLRFEIGQVLDALRMIATEQYTVRPTHAKEISKDINNEG